MRRTILGCVVVAALAAAPAAHATGWHVQQPPGETPGAPTVGLGHVGDVEFWAPNRGMLITGGTDAVPAGLFAYDGTGWYRYATVCGGANGRIAWAGPDDFWTISDQRAGQQLANGGSSNVPNLSLCHFVGGKVEASYAEPIGSANAYEPMDAAACDGPSDCWFAGAKLPGTTNTGAFHLHWDGTDLTAIPSLTQLQPDLGDPARAVGSIVSHAGKWYESVKVAPDDDVPDEPAEQPFVLHGIDLASSSPFTPLITTTDLDRGPAAAPTDLTALQLSSDGDQLWAAAGDAGKGHAKLVLVRLDADGDFAQVTPSDPDGRLQVGDQETGVAAIPGSSSAWIAYRHANDDVRDVNNVPLTPARLVRVSAGGTIEDAVDLPGPGDGIARKGIAGPVACPAADQCWMATASGWLFHLGDDLPRDDDPALHQLVTFRPSDNGVPPQVPDTLPADVSGANPPNDQIAAPNQAAPEQPTTTQKPKAVKGKALVYQLHSRLARHTLTLALTFRVRAKAHVQFFATRKKKTVAKTKRYTLKTGRHTVHLKLSRRHYPTGLRIDAKPVDAPATSGATGPDDTGEVGGTDSTGQSETVSTRATMPRRP